jgi:hypothetical protein
VELQVPDEFIEAVARRVAQILAVSHTEARWLYVAQAAADYLSWPVKRVYERSAAQELPSHKDGGRLMFNTAELDRHVRGQ